MGLFRLSLGHTNAHTASGVGVVGQGRRHMIIDWKNGDPSGFQSGDDQACLTGAVNMGDDRDIAQDAFCRSI